MSGSEACQKCAERGSPDPGCNPRACTVAFPGPGPVPVPPRICPCGATMTPVELTYVLTGDPMDMRIEWSCYACGRSASVIYRNTEGGSRAWEEVR